MTCKYKINELRKSVPWGWLYPCAESIRRYFARCRRYEEAYRLQVAATDVGKAVRLSRSQMHQYKSHRAVAHSVGVESTFPVEQLQHASKCVCCDCRSRPNMDAPADTVCRQVLCTHHGVYVAAEGAPALSKKAVEELLQYNLPCALFAWDPAKGPGQPRTIS
jgi:hypothetical protein